MDQILGKYRDKTRNDVFFKNIQHENSPFVLLYREHVGLILKHQKHLFHSPDMYTHTYRYKRVIKFIFNRIRVEIFMQRMYSSG